MALPRASKEAVLKAISEFDELGRDPFLEKHGFGHAKHWLLVHDGKEYDSKAIYGVAVGIENPGKGQLNDFSGGEQSVVRKLRDLGFEVRRDDGGAEGAGPEGARFFIFTAGGRRAREHLEISLRKGVDLEKFAGLDHLQPTLEEHAQGGRIRVWGARPGSDSERRWERLQPGDVGLVYSEGQFLLSAQVFAKAKSEAVAQSIWGDDDNGEVWACMSFLDPVAEVDVSLADVRSALGYKPNYVPQGFEIPHEDVQTRIRDEFGGPAELIRTLAAKGPKQHVWWVNQNQTFQQERAGGFLWAPKRNKAGQTQAHWEALTRARPGDIVLSYVGGEVAATSTVDQRAEDSAPPDEHFSAWDDDGRRLSVEYQDLDDRIPLAEIPTQWRVEEGGPFNRGGGVKQGYLYPLSDEFVARLAERFPQLGLEPTMPSTNNRLTVETLRTTGESEKFNLRLDDALYASLAAALESGKHVILTGPPGTAKTTLALVASETAKQLGICSGYLPTTATADWTTYETIGGLRPKAGDRLEFEPGPFLRAIDAKQWLVIDELNRSQFDRAFGQLFTVLSGQVVTLPYTRPDGEGPLTLLPPDTDPPSPDADVIRIHPDWRIIATMNVFDKGLLFDMSYALMRRFAFIEVPSPSEEIFQELIRDAAPGDQAAAATAIALLALRRVKDIGPAAYQDIARYCAERRKLGSVDESELRFQAFYSYLLPQFEGITDEEAERLLKVLVSVCGQAKEKTIRETLCEVLGVQLAAEPGAASTDESEAEDGS